jgi:hypothetical protein
MIEWIKILYKQFRCKHFSTDYFYFSEICIKCKKVIKENQICKN